MDSSKTDTHSFIVKIWLEETSQEVGKATWRGHITHVLDNKRRYFEHLDEIAVFIAPYLEQMGVRPTVSWQVRRWLRRWMRQSMHQK